MMIRWLPILALILVSLNLRPALTSLAPLIEVMVTDTGLALDDGGVECTNVTGLIGVAAADTVKG